MPACSHGDKRSKNKSGEYFPRIQYIFKLIQVFTINLYCKPTYTHENFFFLQFTGYIDLP